MRIFYVMMALLVYSHGYSQQQTQSMTLQTPYLLHVPNTEKPAEGYPLILFLHGSGERGFDLNMVKKNGLPSFLDNRPDFPFIVVSPQCPPGRNWDSWTLLVLLNKVQRELPVDWRRIYVTGLSMGGYATWDLLKTNPYKFAAAAPVCGGGDLETVCNLRHTPIWAFHGADDEVVPVEESQSMITKLQDFDSDVKLTVYPDTGHDSWTQTYNNPQLYEWFMQHKLADNQDLPQGEELDKYTGSFKMSEKQIFTITRDKNGLNLHASMNDFTSLLLPFAPGKFKIQNRQGDDSQILFIEIDGEVKGFEMGPCKGWYIPKTK